MQNYKFITGDCLRVLQEIPACSVQTCVTSPPYFGLRDYGVDGQIGLEETPEQYIEKLVSVFREVRRVLKDDGTLWVNLGDSFAGGKQGRGDTGDGYLREGRTPAGEVKQRPVPAGAKPKDLLMIPARVALALQADGWYLRSEIIWHKPNPMPESVRDRPTKAHEMIYLLAKSQKYFYDAEAIKEPSVDPKGSAARYTYKFSGRPDVKITPNDDTGQRYAPEGFREFTPTRNRRDVWTVTTKPYKEAHFATFPPDLIEPCILAGSRVGDTVLDPFNGSGTTGAVAVMHGRNYIGIELNPAYIELSQKRIERVINA